MNTGANSYAVADADATIITALNGGAGLAGVQGATSIDGAANAITLTAAGVANLLAAAGDLAVTDALTVHSAAQVANLGTLSLFGGDGTITFGADAGTSAYTVNLGTSVVTTINVLGDGNHNITAKAAVTETFVFGDTDGGAFLQGLTTADVVDLDAETATDWNVVAEANAGAVAGAGDWFLGAGVLTYYSEISTAVESIALVGVAGLVASTDTFIIV